MTDVEPNPSEPPANDGSPALERDGDSAFVLSGCLTVADALAAHRLATRGDWLGRALRVVALATFLVICIAIAVWARPISPEKSNTILLGGCVIFPALLFAIHAMGRVRLHRYARKQFGMFAPTHSTFSRSKIVSTTKDSKTEVYWRRFSHCISNDTVAILYFKNSKMFLIIPRQKLANPLQWDALVSMIQDQLRRTGSSQP